MNTRAACRNRAIARRSARDAGVLVRAVAAAAAATTLLTLLVGLPWALARMTGWPLPDHLPTWTEVQSVLLEPMPATFLLDGLACVCWLLWGLFTANLARSTLDIVRHARPPDPRTSGPIRRIAAILASTVLISVLGHRAAFATGMNNPTGHTTDHHVAVTEQPATSVPSPPFAVNRGPGPNAAYSHIVRAVTPSADQSERSVAVLAPDPNTGVHDSLWRVAERTLGDGDRWPDIFALNRNEPQPGGRAFTRPSLIYPGQRLRLPADATIPAAGSDTVPDPATDHSESTLRPEVPPSSSRAPLPAETIEPSKSTGAPASVPPRTTPANTRAVGEPGIRWGDGVFVGIGLAAAVSAALTVVRHRHRRRYRPGSGDRADLTVAPVVYQLRLAYRRAEQDRDLTPVSVQPGAAPVSAPESSIVLGIRDARQEALDLAAAHGLGVIGPGASAALRALVVSAAATQFVEPQGARVLVPAEDVAILRGNEWCSPSPGDRRAADRPTRRALPACVQVTADLDAALDTLEAETLVRANSKDTTQDRWPPILLVARTPEQRQRLQAILDNGATVGVIGLLLGQWPAGATVFVRENGTISTTNPGIGEPLRGTQVFGLGIDDTADLLTLLHDADPGPDLAADSGHRVHRSTDGLDEQEGLEIIDAVPVPGPAPRPDPPEDIGSHHRDSPSPSAEPIRIRVLGSPQVWWRSTPTDPGHEAAEREVTAAFQPRLRELLVFLALQPDGASREALLAALWATSASVKTTNAMNTSFSRLRRALSNATEGTVPDIVLAGQGRYRLDPDLVEVDYWSFAAAVTARRVATSDSDRVEAYRRIVDSYTGPVADGLSTEWIETAREAIRRDAIDAVAALARAVVENDPQQTLDLLEIARAFDPHNELIYRDIMRLQERLGQLDAIPRTLTLLATRLAEVDDRPTHQAIDLADRLRRRHDAPRHTERAAAELDEPPRRSGHGRPALIGPQPQHPFRGPEHRPRPRPP